MNPRLVFALLLLAPLALASARDERVAPNFTLPTKSSTVSLANLRGKVVYVDFWASWCGPCRESFPWMSSLSERYAKDGLVVVAINLDKDRGLADAFLQEHPASFKVAFDPAGKTAEAFRVAAMPSSYIISRSGKIIHVHEGFESAKARATEEQIKEALSQ